MHLEAAARRGITSAQEVLDAGPDIPVSMEYLVRWASELASTRTIGMHGAEAFTYPMMESWARLTGRRPQPHEVEALLMLDAIMRNPQAGEEPE